MGTGGGVSGGTVTGLTGDSGVPTTAAVPELLGGTNTTTTCTETGCTIDAAGGPVALDLPDGGVLESSGITKFRFLGSSAFASEPSPNEVLIDGTVFFLEEEVNEANLEALAEVNFFTSADTYYSPPHINESLTATDDNYVFWTPRNPVLLTEAWCTYDSADAVTTAPTLRIEDGQGNAVTMTDITCGNSHGAPPNAVVQSITASGSFVALESVAYDTIIGPVPDNLKITLHVGYKMVVTP